MKVDYEKYWMDRIEKNHLPLMPRHSEIVRVITQMKNHGKVLDLGCGEGHILKMLPDYYEKYGCDISKTAISLVDNRNIHCVLCDLNQCFPFNTRFDFIIAGEVLEHLENPFNVLQNVKKHLTEDGLFLATIPNVTHWMYRLQLLLGKFPTFDESHVNFWDLATFAKLLADYGYKMLDIYPTYFIMLPYVPKIRVFKKRCFYKLFGKQFLFICRV